MELEITKIQKDSYNGSLDLTARAKTQQIIASIEINVKETPGLVCKATLGDKIEIDIDSILEAHYNMPLLEQKGE